MLGRIRSMAGTLKDRIDDAEVLLIGNRFTAAAHMLMVGSVGDLANNEFGVLPDVWLNDALEHTSLDPALSQVVAGTGIFVSAMTYLFTGFGYSTWESFRSNRDHIRKYGKIGSYWYHRSIPKVLRDDAICGYCDHQGIYLAAKKSGNIDEFRELRRDYRNIVPNF